MLPPSAHFRPAPVRVAALAHSLRGHLADTGLIRLYVIAFTLMGSFVTVYNYLTYRLAAPPFSLSPAVIVGGLVLLTIGFFAAHSVASGWVSRRARIAPAQASALYLFAYYLGSSICGSAGGLPYGHGGWDVTVVFVAVLLLVGLGCALSLRSARRGPSPRASAVPPPRSA
ncbi:MAG TPA: hypothetical protein VE733_01385 [Streptosporangiaceae bacterium]|nr:hypothetical protein [Streptosporangiaceae bacterium]